MTETMGQRKTREALELFNQIQGDTQEGVPAGGRDEGNDFREQMVAILEPTATTEVTTTIGKSTGGVRIDGSAVDRLSYKLLRFARDPAKAGTEYVVAVNVAFSRYDSIYWTEIVAQAAWLNTQSAGGTIRILQTEDDYRQYILARFGA